MEDTVELIQGRDDSLGRVLGLYDTPAYVRRGVRLTESYERVFRRCAAVRQEWLRWIRVGLRSLCEAVRDWRDLRPYVESDHDLQLLLHLHAVLGCDPTSRCPRPVSAWAVRARLRILSESIDRFNQRWQRFLAELDLTDVSREVADYNRYYLLEKECAMRSPRLAAKGFQPAVELTCEELRQRFPLLPRPSVARGAYP